LDWFVSEVDPRNAGYRVRTLPIVEAVRRRGVAVTVRPLSELPGRVDAAMKEVSAIVVAKPADTMAALAMRRFATCGKPVVVDLFDNYFAWSPSLVRKQVQWQWLRALSNASLVMTSGPFLRDVVSSITDLPVLTVGDAVPSPVSVEAVNAKWPVRRRLRLAWFGISANPYFAAGIEDLAFAAPMIRQLLLRLPEALQTQLVVCTNRTPAVEPALAMLRTYGIEAVFEDWTDAGCDRLLRDSHVALLPTNAGAFALAKTHNRCSDALVRGCLVLASPSGPYGDIGGGVYSSLDALLEALLVSDPGRVLEDTGKSLDVLGRRNDTERQVDALLQRLRGLGRATGSSRAGAESIGDSAALIAGRTRPDPVKQCRSWNYLTVGHDDSGLAMNYDFRLLAMQAPEAPVAFALGDRACTQVEAMLAAQAEMDLRDTTGGVRASGGGWCLRLERDPGRLVVEQGLPSLLLSQLYRAQREGRGNGQGDAATRWYDAHVAAASRVLRRIGVTTVELATDDEGGWEPFAEIARPELGRMAERLRAHWVRHAACERDWVRAADTAGAE
jgi:hypothetical protein